MRVVVTGASGLIGRRLVASLRARGDVVTLLSRHPERAVSPGLEVVAWDPLLASAPAAVLSGADAVVHLAGEPIAQRWSARARAAIRASREMGTRNLVAGLCTASPRPTALLSASAIGYYGDRGSESLAEDALPGAGFLAEVCVAWEREARKAEALGVRVAVLRMGVVLDPGGGALRAMLPPFRLGLGGPVGSGRQCLSWIHAEDLVRLYLAVLDAPDWQGPVNATAPHPATNRAFSRALGRALHRPALLPVPALALRLLYGGMAELITSGQRVLPAAALGHGFTFLHPALEEALASALG